MNESKRMIGTSTDIVDRLTMLVQALPMTPSGHWRLVQEAADEITRLRLCAGEQTPRSKVPMVERGGDPPHNQGNTMNQNPVPASPSTPAHPNPNNPALPGKPPANPSPSNPGTSDHPNPKNPR